MSFVDVEKIICFLANSQCYYVCTPLLVDFFLVRAGLHTLTQQTLDLIHLVFRIQQQINEYKAKKKPYFKIHWIFGCFDVV